MKTASDIEESFKAQETMIKTTYIGKDKDSEKLYSKSTQKPLIIKKRDGTKIKFNRGANTRAKKPHKVSILESGRILEQVGAKKYPDFMEVQLGEKKLYMDSSANNKNELKKRIKKDRRRREKSERKIKIKKK